MRALFLLCWLALLPTEFTSAINSYRSIEGYWYDEFDAPRLEVRRRRNNLQAREISISGRASKWRTYYHMGSGVFDDCAGRAFYALDSHRIQWRRNRNRPIVLSRGSAIYGYGRTLAPRLSINIGGTWYCGDHNLYLDIEPFGNGYRARQPRGVWTYYDRYSDNEFRDNRGNIYYYDDGVLHWQSRDGRRVYSFRKR